MNKILFLLVLCALPITAMEKDMQHIAGSKLVQILSSDIPLQEKINHIHDTCKNTYVDLSEYDRNGIPIFFHAASENSNEAIKIFTAMSQYCKKFHKDNLRQAIPLHTTLRCITILILYIIFSIDTPSFTT
ncbi:hypothetical protein KG892_03360 [Vermiphilus pyriformis]|nr:MAG: hypothetical protein KG892_03360 [Vermiphilus pyriformis]